LAATYSESLSKGETIEDVLIFDRQ